MPSTTETRKGVMTGIETAIRSWNGKTGTGAVTQELVSKIIVDTGVQSDTAKQYIIDLAKARKIQMKFDGWWAI